MKLVATVLASFVAAIGVIGVFWPDGLLLIGREVGTRNGLYAVAALRIAFGASLLLSAHASKAPNVLRVIGVLVLVAGLATPLFGPERADQFLGRFSELDELWQRFAAMIAVLLGVWIVWALSPKGGTRWK